MSGESCQQDESFPLVNIKVTNGIAELQNPNLSIHKTIFKRDLASSFLNRNELGLPKDWYAEFAAKVRLTIESL
jgi:hypothetical protein